MREVFTQLQRYMRRSIMLTMVLVGGIVRTGTKSMNVRMPRSLASIRKRLRFRCFLWMQAFACGLEVLILQ
ncbi:uncharacterized protein LAESUDRAFT_380662 [Laetiporus sulphureus 93-53]|uniref:Uncharacterized protein n=1 Tax=Laetiporus sulphureus 93-53 TaxID=1314785 RepID=A0A165CLI8_9APHY|nr:uncharacterized protein LAESUDRAFT_380662 [Laetiporus sulphureus 93-53]KZT03025.1 hypothetical protein LAESUDRAFT_380662 [Laetiporus sulphureus 93-53]